MATLIDWLPRIGALLMLIIGLVGFFKPRLFTENLQLQMGSPLAVSEIRTVMGGLNIGSGLAALYFHDPAVYMTLGLAWLFGLLARFYALAADGAGARESVPAFVVDGGLGLPVFSVVFF